MGVRIRYREDVQRWLVTIINDKRRHQYNCKRLSKNSVLGVAQLQAPGLWPQSEFPNNL